MKLPMLTTDAKLAEIRRLYFHATRETIEADLAKALELLKSMPTEEDRDRTVAYMHGLNELRSEWQRTSKRRRRR